MDLSSRDCKTAVDEVEIFSAFMATVAVDEAVAGGLDLDGFE
jgi:hypothetical protein